MPDFSIQFHCSKLCFRPAVDLLEFLGRGIDQSLARARPLPTKEFQFFGLQLVSGDEELLDLLAHLLGQITRFFVGVFTVGISRYCKWLYFHEAIPGHAMLRQQDQARRHAPGL